MVSTLTNPQSGITSGQLWQVGAVSAEIELDQILGRSKLKRGMVEERANNDKDEEEKCLPVERVCIRERELYVLLDSGATPNDMSPRIVKYLLLSSKGTDRVVVVANGDKSSV